MHLLSITLFGARCHLRLTFPNFRHTNQQNERPISRASAHSMLARELRDIRERLAKLEKQLGKNLIKFESGQSKAA